MSATDLVPMALALAGRVAPRVSATTPVGALVTFAFVYFVLLQR